MVSTQSYIGAMDVIAAALIEILQTDDYLATLPTYTTETAINLTQNNSPIPITELPCLSVQLTPRKPATPEHCGGTFYKFTTEGRICTWVSVDADTTVPSLNELGERMDHALLSASNIVDCVTNYDFKEAYPSSINLPTTNEGNTVLKTMAFLSIVECKITYEVIK
jgi:hypothetical protein